MTQKLRGFVQLISLDHSRRDELEIGNYVSWLRRRVGVLKNAETKTVVEIIRHCEYLHVSKNNMIFKQGKSKAGTSKSDFYISLRGSVSVFVNPFLSRGSLRRGSNNSLERALLGASPPFHIASNPKSASSKKTTFSQYASVPEHPESDVSDAESESSIPSKIMVNSANIDSNQSATSSPENMETERQITAPPPSPRSRSTRRSVQEQLRSKLGNFVVKYEKGKSFDECSIMDVNGVYSATVIADEDTDFMLLSEEIYDTYIKEHHENETITMSNFVDIHPFFRHLPAHARGVLQISMKTQQVPAGSYIVKQGDPVNKLIFLISGSAELIIEPDKHRNQYPELWPFETSTDVYYNECNWLRESRRRVHERKYEYTGEVSRRSHQREMKKTRKTEVSVCAVQNKEVIGIAEIVLELSTHMNSLRCIHDCEIYSLALKPFRRLIKKKHPEVMDMVRAYVQMKLHFRLENGIGDKVSLFRSLYNKLEADIRGQAGKVTSTNSDDHRHHKEEEMFKLLKWFKLNKAPLVKDLDPAVVELREVMKDKARVRESVRERTKIIGGAQKQFQRRGCLATVKQKRQPRSLHKLRDPMNELIVRLRMEGTALTEDDLEELLIRYSVTPALDDISVQSRRVIDEEYKMLRYRRYGNRLVRNFIKMIDRRDARYLLGTRERTILSSALLDDQLSENEDEESEFPELWEKGMREYGGTERIKTRPTTYKSIATTDTYKTLQFERRSVTPRTLDMRIKDFHVKFGSNDLHINNLPSMKSECDHKFDVDYLPKPGGKVFVTTVPCVSCMKSVQLKNHSHIRCQMLHTLPMNKVKGYRPS